MTLTKSQIQLVYLGIGSILTLLLLFLSPLGAYLRGDILGTTLSGSGAGLYVSFNGTVGSGVVLDQLQTNINSPEIHVRITTVSGTGGLLSNTTTGVLEYNPEDLTIRPEQIFTGSGHLLDPLVTSVVLDNNGNESGTVVFSSSKAHGTYQEPLEAHTLLTFLPKKKNLSTEVSLKSIKISHILPGSKEATTQYLKSSTPLNSQVSKPLKITHSGLTYTRSTTTSTSSGIIIKEAGTFLDSFQYTRVSYDALSEEGQRATRTLESINTGTGLLLNERIWTLTPTKKIIHSRILGGEEGTEKYDHYGRKIQEKLLRKEGSSSQKNWEYRDQGILAEEWERTPKVLTTHRIMYPNGMLALEENISTQDGLPAYTQKFRYEGGQILTQELRTNAQGIVERKILEQTALFQPQQAFEFENMSISTKTNTLPKNTLLTAKTNSGSTFSWEFQVEIKERSSLLPHKILPDTMLITLQTTKTMSGAILPSSLVFFDEETESWKGFTPEFSATDGNTFSFSTSRPGAYRIESSLALKSVAPLSLSPPESPKDTCIPSSSFKDTKGHWAENLIDTARRSCIINGKSEGYFVPDGLVTRAELTKMALNTFAWHIPSKVSKPPFRDVDISAWFSAYISAAQENKLIEGYGDGTFRPFYPINRAEALKIFLDAGRISKQTFAASDATFPDVDSLAWYAPYVGYAKAKGFASGYVTQGKTLFKPEQFITRAEALKILMNLKYAQ